MSLLEKIVYINLVRHYNWPCHVEDNGAALDEGISSQEVPVDEGIVSQEPTPENPDPQETLPEGIDTQEASPEEPDPEVPVPPQPESLENEIDYTGIVLGYLHSELKELSYHSQPNATTHRELFIVVSESETHWRKYKMFL